MKTLWQGSQNISSKSDLGRLIIIFLGFLALYLMSNTNLKEFTEQEGFSGAKMVVHEKKLEIGRGDRI